MATGRYRLLVQNVAQLVRVCDGGERRKVGAAMNSVCEIKDGAFVVDLQVRECTAVCLSQASNTLK